MNVIDMKLMRYINLLDRVSGVKTRNCFEYNNAIIFAVPREMISRALGQGANNIRMLQEQLGRRIRVIAEPRGIEDAPDFVRDVVAPIRFKSLELKDSIFILNAGSSSKASLIGRNKKRLEELQQIVSNNFGFDLKII
jgi:transcription antitermination factor NusA-like protein